MFEFVFRQHFGDALYTALLFGFGLFLSYAVVRLRIDWLAAGPLAVFRFVLRLMGWAPSVARIAAVIWAFNTVAIFLYMATGWHPLLPKIICVLTGMNIGVAMGLGPADHDLMQRTFGVQKGQWRPPQTATGICGLMVLLLELPAFWYAIALGMSMGRTVQAGQASYAQALLVRTGAYLALLVPMLLASAICEAIAIRGAAARAAREGH